MAFSMKLGTKKTKQYGLIVPKKPEQKSVFDTINTSNETINIAQARRRVGEEAARSFHQQQVDVTHQKALEQDASVFDYDGVYDSIQQTRQSAAFQRKKEREQDKKESKYIKTLMEKAKIREIEHERVRERVLLKEREAEDALYGDKEKFVSASYKRKLQELKRWEEEDARLEAKEALEDVTKREDAMSGFYANLLTKNIAMGGNADLSTSAYTVGKGQLGTKSMVNDQKSEQDKESKGDHVKEIEQNEVKRPRLEEKETDASTEKKVAEPIRSKEEVISAAKARFLARKSTRNTTNS